MPSPNDPIKLPETSALTVSALTSLIKDTLEQKFHDVTVIGEVSQFKRAASGHIYLTLKDESAVLNAIIWRNLASRLKFDLEEGLELIARGSVDVYPPRGNYQLIIRKVEPRGMGELQLAFRQLMEKLREEGLFRAEIKKELPAFPRNIGIVTSPTGAAVRDMTNVIFRRFPVARLFLFPTRVQGDEAAGEIARAIRLLNQRRPELDLIIVGRGGGSLEDLWAFNEEVVARAIYDSKIPIVSAVGHEVDFSISDFVADKRAATPTEAGEVAVPDLDELLQRLKNFQKRLALALRRTVGRARERLETLSSSYVLRHPETLLTERAQRADELLDRLTTLMSHRVELLKERTTSIASRLESLSPLRVMKRGYSITYACDGKLLKSVAGLKEGQIIRTRVLRGWIASEVQSSTEVKEEEADAE